jgi:hypothetical protein
MQARLFAILSGLVLVGCQTLPEVVPFEPRKYCDGETMAHAETMPATGQIDARKARLVVDALRECGAYTHKVAVANTAAATELSAKTSALQPAKDWALIIETCIIVAAVIIGSLL